MSSPGPFRSCDCSSEDLLNFSLAYKDYQAPSLSEFPYDIPSDYQGSAFSLQSLSVSPNFDPRTEVTASFRLRKAAYCDSFPSSQTTPRSFTTPSTPSHSLANLEMVSSPIPLSQVPSLLYPEFSPPSQGSGSTTFERQFTAHLSQEWNSLDTQLSPVARRASYLPHGSLPELSNVGGPASRVADESTSQDAQGVEQRVSLIDKFMSVTANESVVSGDLTVFPILNAPDRSSSPFSDLSDLTPLSSPESSNRYGCVSGVRSTPPTSPTTVNFVHPRKPNTRYNGQSHPNSRHNTSSDRSIQGPSRLSYLEQQVGSGNLKRKREKVRQTDDADELLPQSHEHKRARVVSAAELPPVDTGSSLRVPIQRRLPTNITHHPQFPLFYLRFPVSSYLRSADGRSLLLEPTPKHPGGIYNQPRDALDLYTPRFVKGCGTTKVGLCPICIESPSRGGKGESVWLSMKFSAYNYHLQYGHGISSTSARPFSPPVAFRSTKRQNPAKNERTKTIEGKCHKCKKWIPLESIKNIEVKVEELYWWKHAAACHQSTHIPGDDDFFRDDDIYRQTQQHAP